jgi:hypothetical protein
MKLHNSTAHDNEVRAGVGKVIQRAGRRRAGRNHAKRHEKLPFCITCTTTPCLEPSGMLREVL